MIDLDFGLIIPLGNRWKSYSLSPTTTVCPALFPPCRKFQTSRTSSQMSYYKINQKSQLQQISDEKKI